MSKSQQNGLFILLHVVSMLVLLLQPAYAKILVRVGVYEFPPYVQLEQDKISGFTVELVTLLNQVQQEYQFELVLTTALRRHQDFQQGLFDALFFEDTNWGWQQRQIALQQSIAFAQDDEIFIALQDHAKSQAWFDDLRDKSIAGILGYHYQLAEYQTTPQLLTDKFQIIPISNHRTSIELVLKQRVDTAIVTRSFLFQYLNAHPQYRENLLISERIEQNYQHRLLLDPAHPLNIDILYQWVKQLLQQAEFNKVLAAHGLQILPSVAVN